MSKCKIIAFKKLLGDYESEPGNSISTVALVVVTTIENHERVYFIGGIADWYHNLSGKVEELISAKGNFYGGTWREQIDESLAVQLAALFPYTGQDKQEANAK